MQTVLITLGLLGFGAVVISAYVFTVAARNYVSDKRDLDEGAILVNAGEKLYVVRSSADRRQRDVVAFPLELTGGEVIHLDRRRHADRRLTA